MEQRLGQRRHEAVGTLLVEDHPRLDDVDGRPAEKELEDDDEEHADDPHLVLANLPRVAVTNALRVTTAAMRGWWRRWGCLRRGGSVDGGGDGLGVVGVGPREGGPGGRSHAGHHGAGARQTCLFCGGDGGDAAAGVASQQPQLDGAVVRDDGCGLEACKLPDRLTCISKIHRGISIMNNL